MTKSDAEIIKNFCLDWLKLHHERITRAKKRNPDYSEWNDGLFEGARLSLSHLINFVNKISKE